MRLSLFVALPLLLCLLSAYQRAEPTDAKVDEKQQEKAPNARADDKKEDQGGPRTWSFWRGPEQTGVSREKDLPESFSIAKKQNVVFAVPQGSITSPIVQNGMVYLLGKCGEGVTQQERVFALDADTGNLKWEKKYNVWHTDIVDDRIGFTHAAGDPETGNVYVHLTSGLFICFDKDGKELWKHSLTEEYGRVTGYGGRVTSPIIDEDKVIMNFVNASWGEQTIGGTRIVAFDKKTGKIVWWGSAGQQVKDTYYATPSVGVINGVRTIIIGSGDGHVHAFQVRTGKKLWSLQIEDGGGAINVSPVIQGDLIYTGHGEENKNGSQGRVVCIEVKDGKPKIVWQFDSVKAKFAAPILHDGLLYVCDDAGNLYCFDARTGKNDEKKEGYLWSFEYGKNTKGSPVWADGKIYVSEVDSQFHVLKADRKGCERLSKFRFRGKGVVPVELHGTPAVVNGRVYFTTTEQTLCIGKPKHDAKPDRIPDPVKEDMAKKGAAAHLQIVPADVTLKPGDAVEFKAYSYDEKGRLLGEVKAKWARDGMRPPVFPPSMPQPKPSKEKPPAIAGELSAEDGTATKFTSAAKPNGMFGTITATADKLAGEARVRVVPVLPYAMDFKNVPVTRTPGGWVNAMGKFSVIELKGGEKVLFKRNDHPSPLIYMANAFLGAPDLKNYTIEADVYGEKARNDMPDIGVGACRYNLFLAGNDQELRLGTWEAQNPKRLEEKVKFAWKPGVWYRMKLMATVENGKGIVKGKVWERDKKEPEKWTIEAEDPIPNEEGAPLLYGGALKPLGPNAPGSVIHYANVTITPNKKK